MADSTKMTSKLAVDLALASRHRAKLWAKGKMSSNSRRVLGPHVTGILVQSGHYRFLVDPEDHGVGRHLRTEGCYGAEELRRLELLISSDSDVLVVGAHVGTLAIPLAKNARSVTAIEANPTSFELLRSNVSLNNVDNIELHQMAASDGEHPLSFLANRANSGGSKIAPKRRSYQYVYDGPEEITVQGVRLDDLLRDRSFGLIVMDIEGSEYAALCGVPKLLEKADHLVVEFVPHHLRDVAGVTVEQFLAPLIGFERLFVPSTGESVPGSQFASVLTGLYERDASDDGLIFSRSSPST